jgi:2-polyprenyl-3-methyl-5-hydroxy-6-metoxy-1,4-benzoquinol methylase
MPGPAQARRSDADHPSVSNELHAAAIAAIEAGEDERGHELLREVVAGQADPEHLNDFAVASQRLGRLEDAEVLLRAARLIGGDREDVLANLATLEQLRAPQQAGWRSGSGGTDPARPERAFPGMPDSITMSEHAMRYGFALRLVGGFDVLDLGCGTGYGTEMLTWAASRVRGFDLWMPTDETRPSWPGQAQVTYGHDLCADPLPAADAAVMFEVIEHLADAPCALRHVWSAVDLLIASFPNPVYHGSHLNHWHVNDWTLEQFEHELLDAAAPYLSGVELTHLHQPQGSPLLTPGRDPDAPFWIVVATARSRHAR